MLFVFEVFSLKIAWLIENLSIFRKISQFLENMSIFKKMCWFLEQPWICISATLSWYRTCRNHTPSTLLSGQLNKICRPKNNIFVLKNKNGDFTCLFLKIWLLVFDSKFKSPFLLIHAFFVYRNSTFLNCVYFRNSFLYACWRHYGNMKETDLHLA